MWIEMISLIFVKGYGGSWPGVWCPCEEERTKYQRTPHPNNNSKLSRYWLAHSEAGKNPEKEREGTQGKIRKYNPKGKRKEKRRTYRSKRQRLIAIETNVISQGSTACPSGKVPTTCKATAGVA